MAIPTCFIIWPSEHSKSIFVMTKKIFLLLGFAALFSGCKNIETIPVLQEGTSNPCLTGSFTRHLKKTVTTVEHPGTGFTPSVFKTEYFFDTQGRVDSLQADYQALKIVYAPDGKVDKLISWWPDIKKVGSVEQYFYENGRVSKTERTIFDQNGNPNPHVFRYFYEWDSAGFVSKKWYDGGNDQTIFTRDNCGNALKIQDFYNQSGEEHYLGVAEFADTPSPYFLIGLDAVFPGAYSVNNRTFGQIIHWDCADYDPGPITTQYEYDAENLPILASSPFRTVEFFYE